MTRLTLGHRYEARTLDIEVLDEAGAAVDLTGKTLRWIFTRSPHAAENGAFILTKATGDGITIEDNDDTPTPVAAIARMTFANTDYDDLPAGYYYGELRSMTDDLVYWPRSGESEGDIEILPGSPSA